MRIGAKNIFFTLMGYQLTWFSCIFGEYYNVSVLGLIVGILFLCFFFYFNNNKIQAIKICITFALIGYLFDTILGYSEIFIIQSKIMFGYLPIWLLILWLSFSTLFVDILTFLKGRPFLAFLMGSVLAPPAYYVGIPLGIAKSDNLSLAIVVMMIFWGLFISFYSFYLRKK